MSARSKAAKAGKGPGATETPEDALISNVGSLIRRERQKRDMTMAQLCEVARISQAFLSLVERGKSTPSLGTLPASRRPWPCRCPPSCNWACPRTR